MSWSLIFKACLLLAPVPVCWVLYRYLRASSASLSGTLLERLHFQTSGPLALYLIVLVVTTYIVSPDILEQRAIFLDTNWHYELSIGEKTKTDNHTGGSVRITAGPTGTFKAWSKQNNQLFADEGLINEEWLYLRLTVDDKQRLVAFGARGSDPDRLSLDVYQLPPEWIENLAVREDPLGNLGTLVFEREWPFVLLAYVVGLPLLIVFLLSQIGPPLVAKLSGKNLNLADWTGIPANRIKLELTGAAGAYALILLIVGYMTHVSSFGASVKDAEASQMCNKKLAGTWYFVMTSDAPENKKLLHLVGQVEIECNATNGKLGLKNGVGNRADLRYDPGHECYRHVLPNGGISWKSLLANVIDGEMVAIFKTSAGEDTGLLRGKVDSTKMLWNYYDFREREHHKKALDRGTLALLRSTANNVIDCKDIRERALATQ